MSLNRNRYVIVFDFETDSKDAQTTNPVELAAVPIDLRNLEIEKENAFDIVIRPDDIESPDYYEVHEDTINWHGRQRNKDPKDIVKMWKGGLKEIDAWSEFLAYCKDYTKGTRYDAFPIAGGQNIRGFDIPIAQRLSVKYGTRYPFVKRDVFDLMDLSTYWFLFSKKPPKNHKLETLCEYFDMSTKGSHEAITDVLNSAELLTRFIKLFKRLTPKVPLLNGAKHEGSTIS